MLRPCPQNGETAVGLMKAISFHRAHQAGTTAVSLVGIGNPTGGVRGVHNAPPWRPASVLDEWVAKEARPISLRQLMVFGRSLTEARLISSANYVRTELPTRVAHRLRDMQTLPYVVVTNPHISQVYELYYKAFETLRRVKEIKTLENNEQFCAKISQTLQEHLTVIPKLAMGVLECRELMKAEDMDKFMNTLLRSRISRRVIAEQHLALTETFNSPWHFPDAKQPADMEFVGEVFLKCNAKEVIERCGREVQNLARGAYGPSTAIPEIKIEGHLDATFPYILSHLEYIIGELLRNSIQAVVERQENLESQSTSPPIEITICEAPQHVIIRVSDQGGGIPREILPHLWSFSKGPRSQKRLENLHHVPKMAATLQEIKASTDSAAPSSHSTHSSSLSSLASRPPNLRLGMGLPLSRIYAEYWAGSLELQSLRGFGVDAFLQISKLGNKNEQLTTRATMDAASTLWSWFYQVLAPNHVYNEHGYVLPIFQILVDDSDVLSLVALDIVLAFKKEKMDTRWFNSITMFRMVSSAIQVTEDFVSRTGNASYPLNSIKLCKPDKRIAAYCICSSEIRKIYWDRAKEHRKAILFAPYE